MRPAQEVAIITAASQGIDAGLVTGFRRASYAVVGTSRPICLADEADGGGITRCLLDR